MAPSAPPLTREEFVSLRDGAKGLMHRIPSEHKARLIELGYIEEVHGGIRLTAAGRMRIAEGLPTGSLPFFVRMHPKVRGDLAPFARRFVAGPARSRFDAP